MSSLICSAGADNFEFERKIAVKYEEITHILLLHKVHRAKFRE